MKKLTLNKILLTGAAALVISSCASTPKSGDVKNNDNIIEIVEENSVTEEVSERREAKPLSVKNKTNQQEQEFLSKLADLELKLVSSPKGIVQTQAFKAPFVVKAENSNGPVADLDITVSFPSSKTKDSVIFDTVQLKTDSLGQISFKPDTPGCAVKSEVTFYPTPVNSTSEMIKAATNNAVSAPWLVKSVNVWSQGLIYVYDFNEKGNPGSNSTYILSKLRNNGVNVGNSPISSTSYYEKPVSQLYKDTYAIVGNSCKFMVFGSVKFAEPVVESANGFSCKLVADIKCIDMKNGSELCQFTITETNSDKNRWTCIDKCKSNLSEKVAEQIIYGM